MTSPVYSGSDDTCICMEDMTPEELFLSQSLTIHQEKKRQKKKKHIKVRHRDKKTLQKKLDCRSNDDPSDDEHSWWSIEE